MILERVNCRAVITGFPSGKAPDRIMLFPPGPEIAGLDGRRWKLPDPNALVKEFFDRGLKLVIDWEHQSEAAMKSPQRAPAAGWITALEVAAGAVWGAVEWTAQGRADVEGKVYSYISPSFDYSRNDSTIVRVTSVGLVHAPNLNSLPALNSQSATLMSAEEHSTCARMGFSEAEWLAFRETQNASSRRASNRMTDGEDATAAANEHVRLQMGFSIAEWAAFQALH